MTGPDCATNPGVVAPIARTIGIARRAMVDVLESHERLPWLQHLYW